MKLTDIFKIFRRKEKPEEKKARDASREEQWSGPPPMAFDEDVPTDWVEPPKTEGGPAPVQEAEGAWPEPETDAGMAGPVQPDEPEGWPEAEAIPEQENEPDDWAEAANAEEEPVDIPEEQAEEWPEAPEDTQPVPGVPEDDEDDGKKGKKKKKTKKEKKRKKKKKKGGEDEPEDEEGGGKRKPKLLLILIPAVVAVAAVAVVLFLLKPWEPKVPEPTEEEPYVHDLVEPEGTTPEAEETAPPEDGEAVPPEDGAEPPEDGTESPEEGAEPPPEPVKPPAAASSPSQAMNTAEALDYFGALSPDRLGLEGDSMEAYHLYSTGRSVRIDGAYCMEIMVYSENEAAGTNDVAGRYFISRDASRRIYRMDETSGTVMELPSS